MVQMINGWTRTKMWVAEDRVEEYKAAGHVLVADLPTEEPTIKKEASAPVVKTEEPKKKAATTKKKK